MPLRTAQVASNMADKVAFHDTPKCFSWLNIIEIEFSAISRIALNKRMPIQEELTNQIEPIIQIHNEKQIKIKWQFSLENARSTLSSKYNNVNKNNPVIPKT